MTLIRFATILLFGMLLLASCSSDEETYPSMVSEFVSVKANDNGLLYEFVNDRDMTFTITNHLEGYKPKAVYRAVCGYSFQGKEATLYQLTGAYLLRDSMENAKKDPTNVLSVWRAGKFINMQLTPKTQGGIQYWGFATDSIHAGHAFLSLHHNQNNDPTAYTENVYASLPVDSIKNITKGDTITLKINTFTGIKTWTLQY